MTIDSIKKNQTNEDSKKDNSVNLVYTLTKQIKYLAISMCVLGIATGFSIFQNYEIKEENEALKSHFLLVANTIQNLKLKLLVLFRKFYLTLLKQNLEAANRKHKEDVEGYS